MGPTCWGFRFCSLGIILVLSLGGVSVAVVGTDAPATPRRTLPMRIRLWCDQTGPVPLEEMTFGVRYIGQAGPDRNYFGWTITYNWWREAVQIYRDGERLRPRWDGLDRTGHRSARRLRSFALGQAREYTLRLEYAIELDQITPGRYVIFVGFGGDGAAHAVEFDVWDEPDGSGGSRRVGQATAAGAKPSTRPASPPATRPAVAATSSPAPRPSAGTRQNPREVEHDRPLLRVRLWCDQSGPVPASEMTFGVRYIGEPPSPDMALTLPPPSDWPRLVRVYRDGRPLALEPAKPAKAPEVARPRDAEPAKFEYGETREYTFDLSDILPPDRLSPGRYLLYVDPAPTAALAHALSFEVWDEKAEGGGTRRLAKVTAQGLPVPALAAKRPATRPAE